MGLFHVVKLALPLALGATLFSAAPGTLAQTAAGEDSGGAAQPVDVDPAFTAYLQLLGARARGEGVSEATVAAMTRGLTPNPQVVALDRSQPGTAPGPAPAFWPYYRSHIDAARINGGRAMLGASAGIIEPIEREYGVPGKVLVAIWGKESAYGKVQGRFDLARSLATLAYEGRRRALFEGELIALMKMADLGVPRERMVGSWAGAFGNAQFLPSVYLRLARDGDGDGRADIWNSRADTLASIANYFRDAGWRPGEPWGVRAQVAPGLDRAALATRLEAPSCPRVHDRQSQWKSVAEWRSLGVTPLGAIADTTMASLFEPDGPGNGAFLLTGNYRVILHYNCSNFYALSVGLLADEIAK